MSTSEVLVGVAVEPLAWGADGPLPVEPVHGLLVNHLLQPHHYQSINIINTHPHAHPILSLMNSLEQMPFIYIAVSLRKGRL
jgi:hypothetical protein